MTARSFRIRFSLKTLLVVLGVAGVLSAGWRWWDSTRSQRQLVRFIRNTNEDPAERELLCSLVWQQDAKPLVDRVFRRSPPDPSEIWQMARLIWNVEYVDHRGNPRRVFVFTSVVYYRIVTLIVVATDRLKLLQWSRAHPGKFRTAQIEVFQDSSRLTIVGDDFWGLDPLKSRGAHQYSLSDQSIDELGVVWDLEYAQQRMRDSP